MRERQGASVIGVKSRNPQGTFVTKAHSTMPCRERQVVCSRLLLNQVVQSLMPFRRQDSLLSGLFA